MNTHKTLLVGATLLGMSLAPRAAHALDVVSFGVGLFGAGGVVGVSKPDDTSFTNSSGQKIQDTTYPGFYGPGLGGGIMLEARFAKIVGLEIDFMVVSEKGSGDITITSAGGSQKFAIDLAQTSFRLPVLAKVAIPLPVLSPFFLLGPEFVFPGKTTASVSPSNLVTKVTASSDSYLMVTAGIGLEIKLPVPAVDLRIPFSIRGSVNPAMGSTLTERATITTQGNTMTAVEYKTTWKYQGMATLGLAAYF